MSTIVSAAQLVSGLYRIDLTAANNQNLRGYPLAMRSLSHCLLMICDFSINNITVCTCIPRGVCFPGRLSHVVNWEA